MELETDRALKKYIRNIETMNKSTAYEYLRRLRAFKRFLGKKYKITIDSLIDKLKKGSFDVYDILSEYSSYLQNTGISTLTLKGRVVTLKNFLEFYDVDISPRKFKLKVKLPKVVRKYKEALSREDIVSIVNACSDIRLKSYVLLLAGTGLRAGEATSIRIKDLDLKSNPATVFVRGEFTKTKVDRTTFLTQEIVQQLNLWLTYKYRTRRGSHRVEHNGIAKTITEYRTPLKKETDLIFSVYQTSNNPNTENLYNDLSKSFGKTLDLIDKGEREDNNNKKRRKITLHSFRRFAKTTISNLGYSDFSDFFIGHSGSTYWRNKDSEKAELFRKIEPYLTFLNIIQLERQGADIKRKMDELEELNRSLAHRDQVKDDAISQLSDQLMTLTTRLQELERKQQQMSIAT
jgi:integrase